MSRGDLILMSGGSRIGGDELRGDYVPTDLQFSSSWQGGFKTLDLSLARTASAAALERMYGPVRLVDPNGLTLWQGELRRPDPRTVRGSHSTHNPSALGLTCRAEDREDVQWLGIDRDLGSWRPMPTERRMQWLQFASSPRDATTGEGAIQFDVGGAWTSAYGRAASIIQYNAAPLKVGRLVWQQAKGTSATPDQFEGQVNARDAAGLNGSSIEADWYTTASTTATTTGSATSYATVPRDFTLNSPTAEIVFWTPLTSSGDSARRMDITGVGVIGDHGLPLVGASPATWGIRASDAIPWLIAKFGDGLTAGYIPDTPFAIPHCGQLEPGTLGEAINALNAFHGYTSAVWERGEWDFHPYGTAPRSRSWKITAGAAGVETADAGNDGSSIWAGVVVYYTGPDGQKRCVGPPGSLANTFDSRLAVTDPLNPAVAEGKLRFKRYDLGVVAVEEIAVLAGQVYASELNQARRAGTATVTGWVYDAETGEPAPAYRVRGGDWLTILNAGDDEPHRVLDASYGDGRGTFTLDDGMQYADVLLAHLQGQLTGRL